jgi:hypothetical protein
VISEGDDEAPPRERQSREFERDVLAERRALRAGAGEAAQLRRADAAEAAVQALERQLADVRRLQTETERARERAAEQLADREHELRRVKQREYAEQQLRVEAEENLTRLRRRHRAELDRLQRRVDEARAAMHAAGERSAELRERAEQRRAEAAARCAEAEQRCAEAEQRHARAEQRRVQAEQRCASLAARLVEVSESCARMQQSILALEALAAELRGEVEREREAAHARVAELEGACALAEARAGELERARLPAPGDTAGSQQARREEMAGALAAAVERLRARVAAVGELDTPAVEPPRQRSQPAAPTEAAVVHVVPRVLAAPLRREPWLAAAIRRVAERRDAKLAAELVIELLPAQRLVVDRRLSYGLRLAELDGDRCVRFEHGQAEIGIRSGAGEADLDFELAGRAADFAELAAGGAGRRLGGLSIRGSRRGARALRRARRRPVALWDLAAAGIEVWPGLLLLALAEAIDPRWSVGWRFAVAFEIVSTTACAHATVYVRVDDGAPLAVTSAPREPPTTTVRIGERAFMCMLAGAPLPPGEHVLVQGDTAPLEQLIEWADRAQGRFAGPASLRRSQA